jgi:hypothetical protein
VGGGPYVYETWTDDPDKQAAMKFQAVLEVPEFHDSIGDEERSALSPLFWSHINPYGRFRLNMDTHLDLSGTSSTGGVESAL